ncbi:MAG: peptidoglycan recognition family protein [Ignavibacteria bacterium]|nr:peptidoglycan recognition family protein [Ignavibacteria bacterium]
MEFKESYKYINPKSYIEKFAAADWYLLLKPELQEYFYGYIKIRENKSEEWQESRKEFVKMVCEFVEADQIAFGSSGTNWDKERKSINKIVIHHSSTDPNTSLQVINALGLIRLYAPFYSQKDNEQFGQPIWSNHIYKGKPTFIAYHYIIEQDGTVHHILLDEHIGWQSGNWEINCKSISICFLDDLDEKQPTKEAMQAAQKIIQKYHGCKLLGHKEVNELTSCPGKLFLGKDGWKNLLTTQKK